MTDKRLLWDPRGANKFIVGGGSQLTLYDWAPEYPEIRHLTSKHDLEHMKCFAWSPDERLQDIIAVGYSTGRLELLRLEHTRQTNVLSNGPTVSLPLRNYRSVNALSFCASDPNYLAVGLDKVRGDCSLVVWDIASTLPTMMFPLEPTDSSVVVTRPQPLLPLADLQAKVDRRVVQLHAATDVVSALTFLPESTNLILASMSSRYLRLIDLRSPSKHATNVALKVVGMSPDPFDPRRVACFGEGIVTLWDTRNLVHPTLTFSEKDAAADGGVQQGLSYSSVEFSSTKRGTLATLQKGAHYVRMWDVMDVHPHDIVEGVSDRESSTDAITPSNNSLTKRSWANLSWTGSSMTSSLITDPAKGPTMPPKSGIVLSDTRKSKIFSRPLASFALVPSSPNNVNPLTTNIMAVNGAGDLEFHALYDTPKQASWSARGDLAIGAGHSYRVISALVDEEFPPEPWDIPAPVPTAPSRSANTSRSRGGDKRRPDTPPLGTTSRAASLLKTTKSNADHNRSFSPASLKIHNPRVNSRAGTFPRSVSRPRENVPSRPLLVESRSSKGRKSAKGVTAAVEDDISMIMRKRVISGYGLDNLENNSQIVSSTSDPNDDLSRILADVWGWIYYSRGILCEPSPMINGYDFSYEGLYGIWEGLQIHFDDSGTPVHRSNLLPLPETDFSHGRRALSPVGEAHGNFTGALKELLARGEFDTSWSPAAPTSKPIHRQVALLLIGWSLKDAELKKDIERWEENGKTSRAACWMIFTRHYSKAVDILLRSEDESHHMMSGMLAALTSPSDSRTVRSDLKEHCTRVIVKLQDPYLRMMLTHLALGEWSDVLDEELIPFRERLAIAFQFLDDKSLSSYLRRVKDRQTGGEIDALIVTGLTKAGMKVLQTYVDKSGDIQTAAIMASFVCPAKFSDKRAERWLDAYRDLLDGFRLFHHRVDFDVSRGRLIQEAVDDGYVPPSEWAPRQILIRCNYCNKTLSDDSQDLVPSHKATVCPHCSRSLPRCSICLMTLSVIPDMAREIELAQSQAQYTDTIDDAIIMCQTCRHGGHAAHIMDWFFDGDGIQARTTCAVANCDCQCADEM